MEIPYAYTDTWKCLPVYTELRIPTLNKHKKSGYMGIKEVQDSKTAQEDWIQHSQ